MRITRLHRSGTTLAVVMLSALFIACGGDDGYDGPTDPDDPPANTPNDPAPPGQTANISMSSTGDGYGGRSRSFIPSSVSITASGTVTWTNASDETHNITFAGEGASATLDPGDSHQETFATAGSFPFSCTLHAGMNGTVTVVQ